MLAKIVVKLACDTGTFVLLSIYQLAAQLMGRILRFAASSDVERSTADRYRTVITVKFCAAVARYPAYSVGPYDTILRNIGPISLDSAEKLGSYMKRMRTVHARELVRETSEA